MKSVPLNLVTCRRPKWCPRQPCHVDLWLSARREQAGASPLTLNGSHNSTGFLRTYALLPNWHTWA